MALSKKLKQYLAYIIIYIVKIKKYQRLKKEN